MDGEPIPERVSGETHEVSDQCKDGIRALVDVDVSKLAGPDP